jgi:hypothetical protein
MFMHKIITTITSCGDQSWFLHILLLSNIYKELKWQIKGLLKEYAKLQFWTSQIDHFKWQNGSCNEHT